ncbi:MAG TPA: tetratricopeptide repeat protein [Polyangia bacterium]|nr:tetratricopeptide repeat protein [Polyangia bacterium]
MRAGIVTIVCAAALLAASGVRAESGNADGAQAHFDRGAKQYNLGHFQEAIPEFEKAYDLDPSPIFLFNIAQSHRQLGNKERALFFYRRYLEQAPNAANRDDVERRMKDLQAALQQETEPKQKRPTDVPPPADAGERAAPNDEATPAQPVPATVTAPPAPDEERRPWQVAVGLGAAFASFSGSPVNVPTMFEARLEGGYGIALPAGELAVGVDLGWARLPYQRKGTTAHPTLAGTSGDSAFWSLLAYLRYVYPVAPWFKLGAGAEGGYLFWSGLDEGNPFTLQYVAPSGAIALPSLAGQLRAEVLLVGGLFLALTPELLWSKITSSSGNAIAGQISSVTRFDVTLSVGYAF